MYEGACQRLCDRSGSVDFSLASYSNRPSITTNEQPYWNHGIMRNIHNSFGGIGRSTSLAAIKTMVATTEITSSKKWVYLLLCSLRAKRRGMRRRKMYRIGIAYCLTLLKMVGKREASAGSFSLNFSLIGSMISLMLDRSISSLRPKISSTNEIGKSW